MSGLHPRDPESRARLRAGLLSLGVALLLLAAKLEAYRRTGSAAVLSDALESIVNVVAAAFGIGSILFAGRPADRNHPYGHGKIEYFSAAFEGGLIAFAALLIVYEALQAFVLGVELRDLDVGLAIVLGAGLVNAALGLFLVRTGRRNDSLTLVADGKHVLSDWWTSAGIVVGLLLVRWTGIGWLDPLVACLVALQLFWTGARLVREAARGLLDEEDPELLARLVQVLGARLGGGFVHLHHLRARRAGRYHHVDAHLVVPEFWPVERAHALADQLGAGVIRDLGVEGELAFHTDPCRRAYCASCDLSDCPVRVEPFRRRAPLTVEEAVRPDEARARPGGLPPALQS
ncbi:MAG TPA: cation diffusion facilitator family transporter [Planctomycetota bacterium]